MDPKLTILFILIGGILALSHVDIEQRIVRVRRQRAIKRWRQFVPTWRKP